jgi:hypothetical protein
MGLRTKVCFTLEEIPKGIFSAKGMERLSAGEAGWSFRLTVLERYFNRMYHYAGYSREEYDSADWM